MSWSQPMRLAQITPAEDIRAAETTVWKSLAEFASLATLLRLSGAATMVAAMSLFLLQGWSGGSDVGRFYLLLAQSGLMAAGGFGLSYLLKENKGARVFFGLALLSITANMTTLGALVYSVAHRGGVSLLLPAALTWIAPDAMTLGLAAASGIVVLVPVAIFGFLVLARRSAARLMPVFALTNLLLLVPVRESALAGVTVLAAVLLPLVFLPKRLREDATLRTAEGWFAMGSLFVPAAIVLMRDLMYYRPDAGLQLAIAATAYLAFAIVTAAREKSVAGAGAALISLLLGGILAHSATALFSLSSSGAEIVFGFAYFALGVELARRLRSQQRFVLNVVTGFLTASMLVACLGTASPLVLSAAGAVVLVVARLFEERPMQIAGGMMIALGIGHPLVRLVSTIDFSNGITLAVVGAVAIVSASVIERHGAVIRLRLQSFSKPKA